MYYLSVVNYDLNVPNSIQNRHFTFGMNIELINLLSIDIKVNDLMTLTVTFMLKIAFTEFVAVDDLFHKLILFIMIHLLTMELTH